MNAGAPRLEVGWIGRAHGLRGDVVVGATSNRPERFAAGAQLFDATGRVFTVAASRPQGDRYVVHFDGVATREAAESLRGTQLFGDPFGALPEDEVWVHDLVGCAVIDTNGVHIGIVDAVEENPAHDLLVCDTGVLVPMVFVTDHDATGSVVRVDLPDGLVDRKSVV